MLAGDCSVTSWGCTLHLQKLFQNSRRRCLMDPTPLSGLIGDISAFSNAPVTEVSNSGSRWHPRITLYRLLVISTTISLGSAKAVETFYGKSYVSTTIEWIAGVAVFTLLSSFIFYIFVSLMFLFVKQTLRGWVVRRQPFGVS